MVNEFLKNGELGSIELNEAKRTRQMINERWAKVGMTDGLDGYIRLSISLRRLSLPIIAALLRPLYSLSYVVCSASCLLMTSYLFRL